MSDPIHLVTNGYIPVPPRELDCAYAILTDLGNGILTGFALIAVGPECSGVAVEFTGGRMDRIQLLGNIAMMRRKLEDAEIKLP